MDLLLYKILCFVWVIFAMIANGLAAEDEDLNKQDIIAQLKLELARVNEKLSQLNRSALTVNETLSQLNRSALTVNNTLAQLNRSALSVNNTLAQLNRSALSVNNTLAQLNRKMLVTHCSSDYRIVHNWLEHNFMNWNFIAVREDYFGIINETLYEKFISTFNSNETVIQMKNQKKKFPIHLLFNFLQNMYNKSLKRYKWKMFLRWLAEFDEYLMDNESKKLGRFSNDLRKLLERKLTIEQLLNCISFHWKLSTRTVKFGLDVDFSREYQLIEDTQKLYETFLSMRPNEIKYPMKNEFFLTRFCGALFRGAIYGYGNDQTYITLDDKEEIEHFPEWFRKGRFEPDRIDEAQNEAARIFKERHTVKAKNSKGE